MGHIMVTTNFDLDLSLVECTMAQAHSEALAVNNNKQLECELTPQRSNAH